jgi:DNA-binding beta-propeller fold protein YncE
MALAIAAAGVLAAVLIVTGVLAPKRARSIATKGEASSSARTPPQPLRPPTITGIAQAGLWVVATPGSWSAEPSSFSFSWRRCDRSGRRCRTLAQTNAARYALARSDVGGSLRVSVVASNRLGSSRPALSSPTATVAPARRLTHLEYVFNDGPVSVYEIDRGFKLLETFTLPGTRRGVRGVMVSPATHTMFVSFGGDGGRAGKGSVLAYDMLAKRVIWSVDLHTGIDSGAVSADGKLLYMPDGAASSDGDWYILSTADGKVAGKIKSPGTGPHDGVLSADGRILQLGDRDYARLPIYDTQTGTVRTRIGPLVGGVRPNTINGPGTVSFTTASDFDGFQVGSIATGRVLYTESFGRCTGPLTTCSHGISLSPDNKQLYVIDTVHKAVQVWDVHGVAEGIAPIHVANVAVDGLSGEEKGCAYACEREGWLQHSLDGRYVFVGDAGDVIDTQRREIVARITNLLNTRIFLEVDWAGGVPVATSGRQGIGY